MSITDAVPTSDSVVDASHRYFVDSTEADQGVATSTGDRTIKDHVDAIGATKKATLYFLHDFDADTTTYTLTTSETIPSNITLEIENGAILTDDAGNASLTINGDLKAGSYQIFDWGNGTGRVITGVAATTTNIDRINVKWYGAKGDGTTNDTDAINQAVATANLSADPRRALYFPSGLYLVTPGGVDDIIADIDGPRAVFKASADTTGALLTIHQLGPRYGRYEIRGFVGTDCTNMYCIDPTADTNTIGLKIGQFSNNMVTISSFLGLNIGLFLDGNYNSDEEGAHINDFQINDIRKCNVGALLRAGNTDADARVEGNRLQIGYTHGCGIHVWLDSQTNGNTAWVTGNIIRVLSQEVHAVSGGIGMQLDGSKVGYNKIIVEASGTPVHVGGGYHAKTINGAVNNYISLPYLGLSDDFSTVDFGVSYNVWDLSRSQIGYISAGDDGARSSVPGTKAPTVGTWRKGDIVNNISPIEGGYTGWICVASGIPGTWRLTGNTAGHYHFVSTDETPSVLNGHTYVLNGTTTITDFDDGVTGQFINVIATDTIQITHGTNIILSGGASWTMIAGETLTLRLNSDGKWYETARSDFP